MASLTEIAPGIYRISILNREINLQFNHFLVVDEEPLLYHTGMRRIFPQVLEAVARVIDPATLRWIGFGHFEVDECGSLNEWLRAAPRAQAVAGLVGSLVNLSDFADQPPRALKPDETLVTGAFRFRHLPTPHLPHGWDAGVLFEEAQSVLFCGDLFTHNGDVEPLTESDILGPSRESLAGFQAGPLMDYMPYTPNTRPLLESLAALRPPHAGDHARQLVPGRLRRRPDRPGRRDEGICWGRQRAGETVGLDKAYAWRKLIRHETPDGNPRSIA